MNKEDYSKYYIQGSDHYLIPKDVFIELFEEMSNWKEEAKELKEQLDKMEQIQCNFLGTGCKRKIEEYEVQQKEFINYLKSMLENEKDNFSVARVKDVLLKYKEITGE